MARPSVAGEVRRYLRTGRHDAHRGAWSGDFLECEEAASRDLRQGLVDAVREASASAPRPATVPTDLDMVELTRQRVQPMVDSLFSAEERGVVLGVLEKAVVLLHAGNVDDVLMTTPYLSTAWDLANLYLASIGAELLGPKATRIVGLSEDRTCYVTARYLEGGERFADFVVHEAAHVFHNCKCQTLGLRETRAREWLLEIEFRKRETFAYACEAYAWIRAHAKTPRERAPRGGVRPGPRRGRRHRWSRRRQDRRERLRPFFAPSRARFLRPAYQPQDRAPASARSATR